MGLGSKRLSSDPKILLSASMLSMDGCLRMTLLIVSAVDDALDAYEALELVEREEAEEIRRKDVRKPEGEKRERMFWNRGDCILADLL